MSDLDDIADVADTLRGRTDDEVNEWIAGLRAARDDLGIEIAKLRIKLSERDIALVAERALADEADDIFATAPPDWRNQHRVDEWQARYRKARGR